jgi:integrase
MPRTSPDFVPTYRKHKSTGQAVVTLDGKDRYLGQYNSAASKALYRRLVAEWMAGGKSLPDGTKRTVNDIMLAYLRFATVYYRGSKEVEKIKMAMRPLKQLYGLAEAESFSPLKLKAVRQLMIDNGLGLRTVNMRTSCIKRVFKWAVENELVTPTVYHGLSAVGGLKQGRSDAKDPRIVGPVPEAFVEAVLPLVTRPVRALIELQQITGARSGELCIARACDIDMTGRIWTYRPRRHKNDYRQQTREIYLGPKAQEIIKQFLKPNLEAYLFSPDEAREQRYAEMRAARKSPVQPSQVCRRKKSPKRLPGDRYTTYSYRRAIAKACKRANVPSWFPHQLRHNAGTRLRREFGLEISRILLGHKSVMATQIYAEQDKAAALEVIAKVG